LKLILKSAAATRVNQRILAFTCNVTQLLAIAPSALLLPALAAILLVSALKIWRHA
jgi:hypothetical protein